MMSHLTARETEDLPGQKMVELRENLLAVEKDRTTGCTGCTIEELEEALDAVLGERSGSVEPTL